VKTPSSSIWQPCLANDISAGLNGAKTDGRYRMHGKQQAAVTGGVRTWLRGWQGLTYCLPVWTLAYASLGWIVDWFYAILFLSCTDLSLRPYLARGKAGRHRLHTTPQHSSWRR